MFLMKTLSKHRFYLCFYVKPWSNPKSLQLSFLKESEQRMRYGRRDRSMVAIAKHGLGAARFCLPILLADRHWSWRPDKSSGQSFRSIVFTVCWGHGPVACPATHDINGAWFICPCAHAKTRSMQLATHMHAIATSWLQAKWERPMGLPWHP